MKLAIVVACTDRKRIPAGADQMVRNLPAGSDSKRLAAWERRLSLAQPRVPLRELYMGEAWTGSVAIATAAAHSGWTPELWIASAGLGLRRADELSGGYAATFAAGHPDSVGSDRESCRKWWLGVNRQGSANALSLGEGSALLAVLSASYADAMSAQLTACGQTARQALLVGGVAVPGIRRLPSDLGLRETLGGTAMSLNARMAQEWISRTDGSTLWTEQLQESWTHWVAGARTAAQSRRSSMTDADIRRFLKRELRNTPGLSKSRALRLLRDSGQACEQRRFGALFDEEVQT